MATKKTLLALGIGLAAVLAIGLFNRYTGPMGPTCDSRAAFDAANAAFRAQFPTGSQMNFPFFKEEFVVTDGSTFSVSSRTVLDGSDEYSFKAVFWCSPRGLKLRSLDKQLLSR